MVTVQHTDVPSLHTTSSRAARWSGGRITASVIGALLVLTALALLGAGGTALWADATQREGGYVTSDVHTFSTAGAAVATESTHLGSPGVGWLYSPGILGKVRIRVTPTSQASALFVGIGPSGDVDRYLAGVSHTLVSGFFEDKAEAVAGGPARSAPTSRRFWVASDTGRGERTLTWKPSSGSWTVVVMNADARPGVQIGADLGARMPAVLWIALGLVLLGVVFLAGGGLLLVGALRGRRTSTT